MALLRRVLSTSFCACLLWLSLVSIGQSASTSTVFELGDTKVTISVTENGDGPTYINVHENESTSVHAAMKVMPEFRGRLVALKHNGERFISFTLAGKAYKFDPNRMFTPKGLELSLKVKPTDKAFLVVTGFANEVLKALKLDALDGYPVIALHNNSNGTYSIDSYDKEKAFRQEVESVYKNPKRDSDDFFFVTTPVLARVLEKIEYNVALQKKKVATDDGSLSVYCEAKKVNYINIEAEHGHLTEQVDMLKTLNIILQAYR